MKKVLFIFLVVIMIFSISCATTSKSNESDNKKEDTIVEKKNQHDIDNQGENDNPETNPKDNPEDDPKEDDPIDDPKENDDPIIEVIDEIYITYDAYLNNYTCSYDYIKIELDESERKYLDNNKDYISHTVKITTDDNHKFNEDIEFHLLQDSIIIESPTYSVIDGVLYFNGMKYFNVVKEVRVNLDTTKYEVTYNSDIFTAEIKKPLDYIYIYTLVKFIIDPSVEFTFIVNDVEIDTNKYTIERQDEYYLLTYRIDDPNWTPYY